MGEHEREERQRERDVEVGGGGVVGRLPVLAERQRQKPDEVGGEDEEEHRPDVGEPRGLAALHDVADDAVAGELVQDLDDVLEATRLLLDRAADDEGKDNEDGRGDPQFDHGLVDRQVDAGQRGQADDGMEGELLGDRELLLGAARQHGEQRQSAQSDEPDDAPFRLAGHRTPA